MSPNDKPLAWLHGEIRTPPFSKAARLEAGSLLRTLQRGEKLSMPHSRPMPSIGPRCHELRIVDERVDWRIVYRVDHDVIVIVEVFEKKARKTPQSVIDACRRRLADLRRMTWREPMDKSKKTRLEKKGWRIGSAAEFLGLTPEENRYIELKLALGEHLKRRRRSRRFSQESLAKLLKSSQSRVAKMEAADPSVSLDLLIRSLLALGSSEKELAKVIASAGGART